MRGDYLTCYRVFMEATRRSVLPWTQVGGDLTYHEPLRTAAPIVAGRDEREALERAEVLGRNIMGGRQVKITKIVLLHQSASHG
jgi:hypothetical protein